MDIDKNIEKIIRNQAYELGELLKAHNTKEAWTRAGELNAMLKKKMPNKSLLNFVTNSDRNYGATTMSMGN